MLAGFDTGTLVALVALLVTLLSACISDIGSEFGEGIDLGSEGRLDADEGRIGKGKVRLGGMFPLTIIS